MSRLDTVETDEELMQRFNATIRAQVDQGVSHALEGIKRDVQNLKVRSSRPPGGFGEPNAADVFSRRPSAGLIQNAAFQEFIAATKTRRSTFAIELPFEVKAVTPITGVGLPGAFAPIYGPPQPALRVAQLMYHVPVSTGAVIFTKETGYTPGADLVPEGTTKPGTTMTFANQTLTVQTVATVAKASLQSLNDTPMLMNWIDARLSYAVLLRQEQYLLNDATNGLLTLAPAMAAPPAGSTALDSIALAIGHLTALGYTPDGIVMNPANVTNARLLKDSQGRYIWGNPETTIGTSAMWSLPVVQSPSCPLGSFLVGAFSESTILFDRQVLIVEISFENEDDFIHNLACFRAEMRFALGVPLVNGLAKGTLPAGSLAAQSEPQHHGKK
jgi:hypothetical protein